MTKRPENTGTESVQTGFRPLDYRALAITPNMAIEWGYNLYVIESQPEGAPTGEEARKSVADLNALLESFAPNSPERIYLNLLRMAAVGFARGIFRCKGDHKEKRQAARERKERQLNNVGRDEVIAGLRQGGLKLLLLGGFAYAVARYVLGLPGMSHEAGHVDYFSIASALGVALIGAFFRSFFISRRLDTLFEQFEKDWTEADNFYIRAVVQEYKLAAETASLAYRQISGMDAPRTAALDALLLSMITRDQELGEKAKSPKDRFWYLKPRTVVRRIRLLSAVDG